MGSNKKKLFQNSYIPGKLRIQLWNALISSTLTYALQTQELSESQEKKINSFSQKRMGGIIDEIWYTKKHPEKTYQITYSIHLRTLQPTITSWVNKQSTIAMAKQTSASRPVHLKTQTRMQNIQQNWIRTWEETTQLIQKKMGMRHKKKKQ